LAIGFVCSAAAVKMERLILLVLLAASPVSGAWERFVASHGPKTDSPAAHSLAYFRLDPCLRRDEKRFIKECPQGLASTASDFPRPRTKLHLAGRIGRFAIYDLDTYFDNPYEPPDTVGRKSILVQSGPNEFHEIYVAQGVALGSRLYPTEIVLAGRRKIVVSRNNDGGHNSSDFQIAFVILADGCRHLDFEPAFEAARKAVPKGKQLWFNDLHYDLAAMVVKCGTNQDGLGNVGCCEGEVTVTFRIDESGAVVATGATFNPDAPPRLQ
jgi:hypothetical protein